MIFHYFAKGYCRYSVTVDSGDLILFPHRVILQPLLCEGVLSLRWTVDSGDIILFPSSSFTPATTLRRGSVATLWRLTVATSFYFHIEFHSSLYVAKEVGCYAVTRSTATVA